LEDSESVPDSVPKNGLEKPIGGFYLDYEHGTSSGGGAKKTVSTFNLEENKSAQDNFEVALRQHAADYVSFLVNKKKLDHAKVILENVLKIYGDFLPLLKANLLYWAKDSETTKNYSPVVAAADLVLSQINVDELAKFYGLNHEATETNVVKQNDKLKEALTKALLTKAEALLDMYLAVPNEEHKERFLHTAAELNKWNKNIADTHLKIQVYQEKLKGNLGAALKIIKKKLEGSNDQEATMLLVNIFETLGWHHWAHNKKMWLLIQFPNDYPLF